MKNLIIPVLGLFCHLLNAQHDDIRINQLGYYPDAPKVAIVIDVPDETGFDIIDESGKTAFSGTLSDELSWDKSGETVRRADFSALNTHGSYQVKVGKDLSWPFEIRADAWRQVAVAIMKSYYLQRCTYELEEEYAGVYKRPPGHPDTMCVLHPSSGKSGILSAPVLALIASLDYYLGEAYPDEWKEYYKFPE